MMIYAGKWNVKKKKKEKSSELCKRSFKDNYLVGEKTFLDAMLPVTIFVYS